jgi:hypothetical protein
LHQVGDLFELYDDAGTYKPYILHLNFSTPVCKMCIIQEPKKVTLNKRHFEEKNGECAACLKYSVLMVVGKNI